MTDLRSQHELASFHGMLTRAPQMTALFTLIRRVAKTETSVLIRGETGTGKELVARAIHELSPRASKPFRAINCATLTPELLASEMFGHVKGAFTGAIRDRKGLFELADGGTVFLDEIAEIDLEIQARLLRVIQEREFIPLGATEPRTTNVRLVSATHQSLRDAVAAKRFRADLMYRVRVAPLFLPPLVHRTGDLEALTWHFITEFNDGPGDRRITSVADEAMDAILSYEWPGNVRELRNVIEGAFALGEGTTLGVDDLTPELRGREPGDRLSEPQTLPQLERELILNALRESGGRRQQAAELLGMSRTTLWRKLREHQLT